MMQQEDDEDHAMIGTRRPCMSEHIIISRPESRTRVVSLSIFMFPAIKGEQINYISESAARHVKHAQAIK